MLNPGEIIFFIKLLNCYMYPMVVVILEESSRHFK